MADSNMHDMCVNSDSVQVNMVKKLSKSEKKLARKQAKSRHTLLRHEGIHISDIPTKHLIVGNGGLGNGVSRSDIKHLFSQYGQLTDIVMVPRKPYSVICFASLQEAIIAHDRLQAWQLRPPTGPAPAIVLYLSYISEVPHTKMSDSQHSLPPGLILIEDFVSTEMEETMMQMDLWEDGDQTHGAGEGADGRTVIKVYCGATAQQRLKHRSVQHFGYEFNYVTNNVDKDSPLTDPMPTLYINVIDKIMATGLVQNRPDQITVNEYQPGQGIPPHVDTHSAFQGAIISLSLGSQILMEFTNPIADRQVPVFLPRRSLLIMTGEARYLWSHGITPRKSDVVPAQCALTNNSEACSDVTEDGSGLTLMHRGVRRSLTFRAVRAAPCNCDYPSQCDTQRNTVTSDPLTSTPVPPSLPTSDLQAMHLEAAHVHQVYESIADHFSQTRHKPWPQVLEFIRDQSLGSILLDVGCGNGKYLDGNPRIFSIGCDRSVKLVEICTQRGFPAFSCDGLNLPVRTSCIDACICIAVIHHFSTENRRIAAIREIARVLRPGGLGLIYVWAKEQEKDHKKSHYISNAARKKIYTQEQKGRMNKNVLSDDGSQNEDGIKWTDDVCLDKMEACSVAPDKSSEDSPSLMTDTRTCMIQENKLTEIQDATMLHTAAESSDFERNNSSQQTATDDCHRHCSSKGKVLLVHKNRTEFESQDMLVPWHLKKKTSKTDSTPTQVNGSAGKEHAPVYHRFYHVFEEGELEGLCRTVPGVEIKCSHYDQGNWGVVIQKV